MPSRTWIVTGASRGLGRAFAEAALAAGENVVVTARDRDRVCHFEERFPDRALAVAFDVDRRESASGLARAAVERFQTLDVLVNSAGYGLHGAIEEISEDEARRIMETNFFGVLWMTQAALPYMRRQGRGRIVQVSSIAGAVGFPLVGMYAAGKFAVEGMSECVALEAAPFGVKVTILQPGGFRTGFRVAAEKRRRPIAAYEEQWANQLDALSARHAGAEEGDPTLAARALLELVDDPDPPLRVLFGNSAFDAATSHGQRQIEEWQRYEQLARSVDG
jgi:NAD(P)-dependent dehydrogenase (short-subunit alcohol dehydrogenase family)